MGRTTPLSHLLLSSLLLVDLGNLAQAEPIKIGLNYPRTGNYKDEGLELRRGALLAVDEINQAGGVLGKPLELLSKNTSSQADKAVSNVDYFANQDARMVFGGATSEEAIAAGKRARELGLLYFGTLTYSNDTTGKDGHRHMFRECNNAWMSARALGQYLNKTLPDQDYFYITADYTWGHTSESSLRQTTGSTDQGKHPGVKVPFPGARMADYQNALTQAAAGVDPSRGDALVVRAMKLEGMIVRREPMPDAELADLIGSLLLVDTRQPIGLAPPGVMIPPRQYSDETLARVASIPNNVLCECPRHVAELIGQLASFEQYSQECLNNSAEDARLHAQLSAISGSARALFERALEMVAQHEGIALDQL